MIVQRNERGRATCATIWVALLLVLLPASAVYGQDRPERAPTGRHKAPADTSRAARSARGAEWGHWSFQIGGGVLSSGDLFRVVVPSGFPRPWLAPSGAAFNASEFLVTLDEDLLFGAAVSRALGGRWHLRADLAWAQVDATAEARISETVELHLWERLTFVTFSAGVECRLVDGQLTYPYAMGGVVLAGLSATKSAELDQTVLAPRLGVGFQLGLRQGWCVRAEVRDTIRQFDLTSYGDSALFEGCEFEQRGPQHLFEVLGAVRIWL